MIFVKKTSSLFDKKDKKCDNQINPAEKIPETEEEKQKAAILKIREALGQDTKAPIETLETKKIVQAVVKDNEKTAANDDEVWVPKTEEEIKQKAAILKIKELLGEDTSVPIKISDIKKLEAEKLEAEKKEAELEAAKSAPVAMAKAAESDDKIWVPKTEEEKLQQAAILKIRELLGEDTKLPIEKKQAETPIHNYKKDNASVKPDSNTPELNKEEVSPQYLLLKKLLEEDSATKTETKPAKKEKEKIQPSSTPIAVSGFGRGSVFTVDDIINAKPNVPPRPTGFSWGSGNCFNLEDIINAKPTNAEPETKKETKLNKESLSLEYKGTPKTAASNSPFFIVNFKDLTKG